MYLHICVACSKHLDLVMESVNNVLTSMAEDKSSLDLVELATRAVDPVAWRDRVFARLQSFNDFAAETFSQIGFA